jgi:CRISPR system Cascade subunit CasA
MEQFDLAHDRWLPLRGGADGELKLEGIEKALCDAHMYSGLVVEVATQLPALLRQVLLPVVADQLGLPGTRAQWRARFEAGAFSEDERQGIREYLSEHGERFHAFGAQPFAQVGDLEAVNGGSKGAGLLVVTESTGNNVPLFSARTEAELPLLTPAEAMRWVVHAHCWDTAAIKTGAKNDGQVKAGKTTGNPTGPLGQLGVLVPVGRTLYETLLLNLPIGSREMLGTPHWRRPPLGASWNVAGDPDGLLALWTWQSRRIRLIPEQTPDGVRVRRVIVAAGDRLREIPDWEPHTAWKYDKPVAKSKPAERRPRRHQPGKAIWRGLEALLAVHQSDLDGGSVETSSLLQQAEGLRADGALAQDYPLCVEAFGLVYGNQSAVVEDLYHDLIPLPVAALRQDADIFGVVVEMTGQAERLQRVVNGLSADLRRASGLDPIPWDKGQRPGEQILHLLDPVVRRILTHLGGLDDEQLEAVLLAWEKVAGDTAREIADTVFAGVPESVFGPRRGSAEGKPEAGFGLGQAESRLRRALKAALPRYQANSGLFIRYGDREDAMARPYWNRVDPDGTWAKGPGTDRPLGPPPGEDLAAMRAGLGRGYGEVPRLWRHYTCAIDDDLARRGHTSQEQQAEHAALALYGLHQQSKKTSMHRSGVRLGRALAVLRDRDRFSEKAVDDRVEAAATSTTQDMLLIRLRGLIDLLRAIDQPLDYNHLMQLIRSWNFDDGRRTARREWAVDYQVWRPKQPRNEGPAES